MFKTIEFKLLHHIFILGWW